MATILAGRWKGQELSLGEDKGMLTDILVNGNAVGRQVLDYALKSDSLTAKVLGRFDWVLAGRPFETCTIFWRGGETSLVWIDSEALNDALHWWVYHNE